MANKRMFSQTIIDSDTFLEMPISTQALYFHLSMRADDEGFIDSPKKIMKIINSSNDDLKILIGKRYILVFESGVIVIKHWKLHNCIRKDRLKETLYLEEKKLLNEKENGAYTMCDIDKASDIKIIEECQPTVNQLSTNCPHRLDKIRLDKVSIDKNRLDKKKILITDLSPLEKTINDFIDFRKGIKAKMGDRAVELLRIKLDKLADNDEDKIRILEQSIMNGWKSIYELKGGTNGSYSTSSSEHNQNEGLAERAGVKSF